MAQYKLSENARADVKGLSPFQVLFFTMSSRRADAIVVSAHISKSVAQRAARVQHSCVRVGRVQADLAVTVQEG